MPAQPPVGLKLGQQKTEWALAPAFSRAHYPRFQGHLLGYPAAWMRVVDGRPGVVGMIAEKGEGIFHNNSNFFYKCNDCYYNLIYLLKNKFK